MTLLLFVQARCAADLRLALGMTLFFFALLLSPPRVMAQAVLDNRVTIQFADVPIREALNQLADKANCQFVFASDLFPASARVSYKGTNKRLDIVLAELLKAYPVSYNPAGKYVYIRKKNVSETRTQPSASAPLTGRVTDAQTSEPMVGVNIAIRGTAQGTTTDTQGEYRLPAVNDKTVLVFSFIGYERAERTVGNQSVLDVALAPGAENLNQVVVVGYGTQNSRYVTGSVATVKAVDIEPFAATTIEQSLSGKVPGVQFLQSSGQPGAGVSVRVRGVSSIAGGNEPLYVIDGVPFFNNDVRGLNGLSAINPTDIESIDVLKDAAATAIYGSRGGNGVILITTKSGKSGKSFVEYSTWAGYNEPRKKLDLLSGDEYRAYVQTYYKNSNLALPADFATLKTNNTDWQAEVFRRAFRQNHNLTFAGGTDQSRYYTSLTYGDEDGIIIGSNFKKYSFLTRLDNQINDVFSVQASVTAAHTEQNGLYPADNNNTLSFTKTGVGSAVLAIPTEPVYTATGAYSNVFPYVFTAQLENPVAYAQESLNRIADNRIFGSFTLTAKIAPFLVNRTRIGVNFLSRRQDTYFPKIFQVVYAGLGYAILDSRESLDVVAENFLEFNRQIAPKLTLTALAGGSLQSENAKSYHIEGQGFISDALKNNAIQAATTTSVPQTYLYQRRLLSAFGRATFNYDQRYVLEANLRRDGASVFSANHKIAVFPSVAFSWLMSNERFARSLPALAYAKLRLSWGQSGNQAIQPYQSLPIGTLLSATQSGGSLSVGLAPNLPNTDLTWETSTQSNIGIDLGLFRSRLRLVADYYVKQTKGALSTVQLAPSSGFNNIIDNVGEVENKGFELGVDADLIRTESLRLTAGLNLSHNVNRVTGTKNNQVIVDVLASGNYGGISAISGYSSIQEGQPLGAVSGFVVKGYEQTGVPIYEDANKDGKIDAKDLQIIGNPYPQYLFGANLNLAYKRFNLTTAWQGVYKAQLFNLTLFNLTSPTVNFNRARDVYTYSPVPKQGINFYPSDLYEENASFLRLRNIRLDYALPLRTKGLKKFSVYASAQNLLTITSYKGYDPEVNSFSGNDIKQGYDNAAFPTAKSLIIGLSIQY